MENTERAWGLGARLRAWFVHLFTASGLLTGFMAILAIQAHEWRAAILWMIGSLVIDSVDGTLARRFRVREVLPFMNGQNIDYVIDFATYAIIPAYFFYEFGLVEGPWNLGSTFVILLVSAIYYGKEGMVSDDMFFIGFPVLWNVVVFYLVFVFDLPSWGNAVVILVFACLHFIPIKYPYPSRNIRWRKLLLFMTCVSILAGFGLVWGYPNGHWILKWTTIAGLIFYFVFAIMESYFPIASGTGSKA